MRRAEDSPRTRGVESGESEDLTRVRPRTSRGKRVPNHKGWLRRGGDGCLTACGCGCCKSEKAEAVADHGVRALETLRAERAAAAEVSGDEGAERTRRATAGTMVDLEATSAGDSGRALARLSHGPRRGASSQPGQSAKDAQQRAQRGRQAKGRGAAHHGPPGLGE